VRQSLIFKEAAYRRLLAGAGQLAEAVGSTMGPSGHTVIIDVGVDAPLITKDGVTVAKAINLRDPVQRIGANLIREVASKTNEQAGDGTTTATVLSHGLLHEGIKHVVSGRDPVLIKQGMDQAKDFILKFLSTHATPIKSREDIVNVGTISANGDREIGELIARAIEQVGADGIVTVELAQSVSTSLEVLEGMQFANGYISPFFINNPERASCELINPRVLLTSNKISTMDDILKILEQSAEDERPILILADEVDGEALHSLIVNTNKGIISACAVKAPAYGELRAHMLDDLSRIVGGEVFGATSPVSLRNATCDHLGRASKAVITRGMCTLVGHRDDPEVETRVTTRVDELRKQLGEAGINPTRAGMLRERLARLSGGIAVIKVGGATEVEIREKRDRVEDAVNATVAASQEGVVPGGGAGLFYAGQALLMTLSQGLLDPGKSEDVLAGVRLVAEVCNHPLATIVRNTGDSKEVVLNQLKSHFVQKSFGRAGAEDRVAIGMLPEAFRYGFDASTKEYTDLLTVGVIDPVKVTKHALENAISIVGLMLTCECVVINIEDDDNGENT
jgi:chaperonin GroEL